MIPSDPVILLGFLNMKLRDYYSSLEALCDDLDEDESAITAKMKEAGYHYSMEHNQFIACEE